ncbi:hypothetical protein BDC45DRAFT_530820 [Circinella umbellata]|nr:hypothetical protein BDC45DRAFT_530820 [Circinella umbellata]
MPNRQFASVQPLLMMNTAFSILEMNYPLLSAIVLELMLRDAKIISKELHLVIPLFAASENMIFYEYDSNYYGYDEMTRSSSSEYKSIQRPDADYISDSSIATSLRAYLTSIQCDSDWSLCGGLFFNFGKTNNRMMILLTIFNLWYWCGKTRGFTVYYVEHIRPSALYREMTTIAATKS